MHLKQSILSTSRQDSVIWRYLQYVLHCYEYAAMFLRSLVTSLQFAPSERQFLYITNNQIQNAPHKTICSHEVTAGVRLKEKPNERDTLQTPPILKPSFRLLSTLNA